MADEWPNSSLGDYVEIKHGFAFEGEHIHDQVRGDILLTPGNFAIGGGFKGDKFKYYDGPVPQDYVLERGDLIVTMTDLSKQADTLGYPAVVPHRPDGRRFLHNQRLGKIEVRDPRRIDRGFLHYLLRTPDYRHEVLASATGTTVKHTSPERIKRFQFRRPPLPEQKMIAHVLGTLDDKIELNRRMSETLVTIVRALFKSWFVDFDPVRAKIGGRNPGLPKPLADLFPSRLVDSELGRIPEGWTLTTFGDCVRLVRDQENPLESPETSFRHFSIPAFDDWSSPKNEQGATIKSQKSRVPPGAVLISKLNPEIERVWLVDVLPNERAICSTEFLVLLPERGFGRAFLYCLSRSPAFRTALEGLVTGTSKSHQRAPVASVLALPVVRAHTEVLASFERTAEPLLERALTARREMDTLAAMRDALLPRLVSGQLPIANAERFLEQVGT